MDIYTIHILETKIINLTIVECKFRYEGLETLDKDYNKSNHSGM